MSSKNYIDFDSANSYVLQWIYESIPARHEYQNLIYRANLAMLGKPCKNLYQEEIASNLNGVPDSEIDADTRARCLCVPEGRDFTIRRAVSNRANQMASGVDRYE